MRLKVWPAKSIDWLALLWMLLSGFLVITELGGERSAFFLTLGSIAFGCGLLIWLDVRQVALPLMIWFGFVVICAVLILVLRGLALKPILAVFMAASTVYEINEWRKSDEF